MHYILLRVNMLRDSVNVMESQRTAIEVSVVSTFLISEK